MSPKENAPDALNVRDAKTITVTAVKCAIEPRQSKAVIANQVAQLTVAGHVVYHGQDGDFTVCKYGMSRYCKDFAELAAFTRQLGVKQ